MGFADEGIRGCRWPLQVCWVCAALADMKLWPDLSWLQASDHVEPFCFRNSPEEGPEGLRGLHGFAGNGSAQNTYPQLACRHRVSEVASMGNLFEPSTIYSVMGLGITCQSFLANNFSFARVQRVASHQEGG